MILDKKLEFSDAQAITADAASTVSYDTGALGDMLVKPLRFHARVVADFNNLTSLRVYLQMDNDSAFGSPTVVWDSTAILLASLLAGYQFTPASGYPLPTALERYLRCYYDVTGTAPSTGSVDAFLTFDADTNEF